MKAASAGTILGQWVLGDLGLGPQPSHREGHGLSLDEDFE